MLPPVKILCVVRIFFLPHKKTYLALSEGSRKKMIESVADSFALIVAAAG